MQYIDTLLLQLPFLSYSTGSMRFTCEVGDRDVLWAFALTKCDDIDSYLGYNILDLLIFCIIFN